MTGRSDDLAARFASRMKGTPAKGRLAGESVAAEAPVLPPRPVGRELRPRRGSSGTVLRGHLVPAPVHAALSRRKVELQMARGVRVTWSDVVAEALEGATADRVRQLVDSVPGGTGGAAGRLVQATLTGDDERRFLQLRLELANETGRSPSIEALWTAVLAVWLDQADP